MGSSFVFVVNSVGKSPRNHKQECKSISKHAGHAYYSLVPKLENLGMMLGHAQEKPHLLICACMIGDFGLIKLSFLLKSDAAWPEKQ